MKKYLYITLTVFTASLIFGLGDTTTEQPTITLEDLDPSFNRIQIPELAGDITNMYCCKICKKGKACGDTCISKSYTCRQPSGCACNG